MKAKTTKKELELYIPKENLYCYLKIYLYIKDLRRDLQKNPISSPSDELIKIREALDVLHLHGWINNISMKNKKEVINNKWQSKMKTMEEDTRWEIICCLIEDIILSDNFKKWKISEKLKNKDPQGRKIGFPTPLENLISAFDKKRREMQLFDRIHGPANYELLPLLKSLSIEKKTASGRALSWTKDFNSQLTWMRSMDPKPRKRGRPLTLELFFLIHALEYDLHFYNKTLSRHTFGKLIADYFNKNPEIDKPILKEIDKESSYTSKSVSEFFRKVSQNDMFHYLKYAMYFNEAKFKEAIPASFFPYSGFLTELTTFEIRGHYDEDSGIFPRHYLFGSSAN